jgi:2-phospho-L-lactate/phosphoenolpyruvate guanylyltransferase
MRTIAILPIKSFGAAKQRLAGLLGGGSREALAQAMFSDVLTSLRHVPDLDGVAVVTANRMAEDAAALHTGVTLLADTDEAGQSAATQIGLRHATANGYERALLVPGDTPLLDPLEVAAMFDRADEGATAVTIVPDRHGEGTNALLLTLPAAIEPAFGPGSLERHTAAAQAAGTVHRVDSVASLALDVDTPEDLATLRETLAERHGQAPMTRGALRQIDRSQVGATVGSGARVGA